MPAVFEKWANVVKRSYVKNGVLYTYGHVILNLPKEYIGRRAKVLIIVDDKDSGGGASDSEREGGVQYE